MIQELTRLFQIERAASPHSGRIVEDSIWLVLACAAAVAIVSLISHNISMAGAVFVIVAYSALASTATVQFGLYDKSHARAPRDNFYFVCVALAAAALPLLLLSALTRNVYLLGAIVLAWLLCSLTGGLRHARRFTRAVNAGHVPANATLAQLAYIRPPVPSVFAAKRTLDVIVSLAALTLFSPVLLVAAALIYIDSGSPILFRQERVGRDGVPFLMYKLRTMRVNAGTDWAKPADNRITRIGALLRRTSVDELPQFFNVLRGDMSVVGPRPETVAYARDFTEQDPRYAYRHFVAPGITGWAQVHMPRNLTPDDMPAVLEHDLYYVKNASAFLDAAIIVKTAVEFLGHHAV